MGKFLNQKEINDLTKKAKEISAGVDISTIFDSFGVETVRKYGQLYAPCYKCGGDPHTSSKFSANLKENKYFCFGCREGGGPGKLFSVYAGVPITQAYAYLAYQVGGITDEEYEALVKNNSGVLKRDKNNKIFKKMEEPSNVTTRTDSKTIGFVYEEILPMFGEIPQSYRFYLQKERRLTEEEIKECGFFAYKKPFSIDELVERLQKKNPQFTHNDLMGVPGFFFEFSNAEKTKGFWRFKSPYKDCLGIPLRDSDGDIVAFQFRNMSGKEVKNKYFYLSSASMNSVKKGIDYGCTCGSPVAVLYPKQLLGSTFAIGEGFFKMNEIAKEGIVAMSVQGVNNISYVADEVKKCLKSPILGDLVSRSNIGRQKVRFLIVYDADMYRKVQVLEAAINTANYLKKQFPDRGISFLIWDSKLGKGYDDMKFYCLDHKIDYHQMIKAVSSDIFVALATQAIKSSDELYFVPGVERDIKGRQTEQYANILEQELWYNRIARL